MTGRIPEGTTQSPEVPDAHPLSPLPAAGSHRPAPPGRSRLLAPLLLALLLLFPVRTWRACQEGTLWLDEIISLMLIQHSPREIIDERLSDRHPPGYFLALKTWVKGGKLIGMAPSTGWARMLNITFWTALALACWFCGRRLAGGLGGGLLIWCVAGSAQAGQVARDLRGYGPAFAAVTACFLLLALALRDERSNASPAAPRTLPLLAAAALCAAFALWTHMLSGVVLALLLAAALLAAAVLRRPGGFPRPLAYVAAGLLLGALTFIPWALAIGRHWGKVISVPNAAPWRTPATLSNLTDVFLVWYPFGPITPASPFAHWLMRVGGALALLVPAGALLLRRRSRSRTASPRTLLPALVALGLAAVNVLLLWGADRLGLAQSFHGPRYMVFTAGIYAAAIALLCLEASSRLGVPSLAWLLAAPWLVCAVTGQGMQLSQEKGMRLSGAFTRIKNQIRPSDLVLASPDSLRPYFPEALRQLVVKGGPQALRSVDASTTQVVVLDLNFWDHVAEEPERVLEKAAESGLLSERSRRLPAGGTFSLLRLDGLHHGKARELAAAGFSYNRCPIPEGAISSARTEDQLLGDGWTHLELLPDLSPTRWGQGPASRVAFDRELPPGNWTLHLVGMRPPFPEEKADLTLSIDGEDAVTTSGVASGPMHLQVPLTTRSPHRRPILTVRHPIWRASEKFPGSSDPRQLTFHFQAAWLEPRKPIAGR